MVEVLGRSPPCADALEVETRGIGPEFQGDLACDEPNKVNPGKGTGWTASGRWRTSSGNGRVRYTLDHCSRQEGHEKAISDRLLQILRSLRKWEGLRNGSGCMVMTMTLYRFR